MIGALFQDQPIPLLRLSQMTAPMAIQRVSERTGEIVAPLCSRYGMPGDRAVRSHGLEFLDERCRKGSTESI
jgi:hypothetical protein